MQHNYVKVPNANHSPSISRLVVTKLSANMPTAVFVSKFDHKKNKWTLYMATLAAVQKRFDITLDALIDGCIEIGTPVTDGKTIMQVTGCKSTDLALFDT